MKTTEPFTKKSYRIMHLIRHFESFLLELFSKGELFGTTHTYSGQEAVATGVIEAIDREIDIVFSNHRCHGHYLCYSDGKVEGLLAEIMGRQTGVNTSPIAIFTQMGCKVELWLTQLEWPSRRKRKGVERFPSHL